MPISITIPLNTPHIHSAAPAAADAPALAAPAALGGASELLVGSALESRIDQVSVMCLVCVSGRGGCMCGRTGVMCIFVMMHVVLIHNNEYTHTVYNTHTPPPLDL